MRRRKSDGSVRRRKNEIRKNVEKLRRKELLARSGREERERSGRRRRAKT